MGNFHRLTTPAYFTGGGTFPTESGVAYDYINNGGGGTPANADGAKGSGTNAGTYFVAFGEDATSANANRPNRALAENADHIDDVLHRDLAIPVRTVSAVAGGGGVSTITLPIGTYLGPSGTTNTSSGLAPIFSILDDNDREILASGVEVKVNTVTLGGGDALGADGFSANTVQLNISPAIPSGVTYRVYYASRGNLATLSTDAFSFIKIRGAQEIDADVESVLAALHGNNLVWDAAWTSTIYDLTIRGIQGSYDRDVAADITPPTEISGTSAFILNPSTQSGMGGWFERIGPALTGFAQVTTPYLDPVNAVFAAKFGSQTLFGSGGSVGFVAYGNRRYAYWDGSSAFDTEETAAPEFATFLSLRAHTQSPTSLTTNGVNGIRTRIPLGTTCLLSSLGDSNTGSAGVTLTGADSWYRDSVGKTAIMVGYDMVEIQYTQGGVSKREFFVIIEIDSPTVAYVRRPDGKVPSFTGASAATVVGWHSIGMALGDGAGIRHSRQYGGTAPKLDGFFYAAPTVVYDPAGSGGELEVPALFFANGNATNGTDNGNAAMRWGYFEKDTTLGSEGVSWGALSRGALLGNGAVISTRNYTNLTETLRIQPQSIDQRSVVMDHGAGSTLSITADVAQYNHFIWTLSSISPVNQIIQMTEVVFATTAPSGKPELGTILKGSIFVITFKADAAHTDGIVSFVGSNVFPASVKGLSTTENTINLAAGEWVTYTLRATSNAAAAFDVLSVIYGGP